MACVVLCVQCLWRSGLRRGTGDASRRDERGPQVRQTRHTHNMYYIGYIIYDICREEIYTQAATQYKILISMLITKERL